MQHNPSAQEEIVQSFFDKLSPDYQNRLSGDDLVMSYMYNSRTRLATAGIDLNQSNILDIGCGTGILYEMIGSRFEDVQYYGCDISKGMIEHSIIPIDQRFCGKVWNMPLPSATFKLIAMLGLTTYLSQKELEAHLSFLTDKLSDDGRLAITFTNKDAIGVRLRVWFKPILKLLRNRKQVATSDIQIKAYSKAYLEKLLANEYEVVRVFPQGFIFPGLKIISPKLTIKISNWLEKKFHDKKAAKYFAGDWLCYLRKKR